MIIGDLNLDRLSPGKREGKLLLDLEIEQGLTCLISKPTRVERRGTVRSHSLIDVLFTNRPELSKQSGNYYPALSDHALIFGIVRDRIKSNKPKIISFRSFKNFNAEIFNQELSLAPWHVGEIYEDVEDQLFYWNTLVKNIVDEHAPVKTMRVRDHDVPYMTTKWKNAIRVKRKAEAKYRQNKTAANCEHKRICRNEATKQRRLAIKEYWKTESEDLRRNSRDFFKTFKPFLSDKGIRSDPDIELNIQGNFVKDQIKVTEILADHFATIADGIGGTDAELRNLEDFNDHPNVQLIEDS